jgi:hypothetical protein
MHIKAIAASGFFSITPITAFAQDGPRDTAPDAHHDRNMMVFGYSTDRAWPRQRPASSVCQAMLVSAM